jgi:hypothetical protein
VRMSRDDHAVDLAGVGTARRSRDLISPGEPATGTLTRLVEIEALATPTVLNCRGRREGQPTGGYLGSSSYG